MEARGKQSGLEANPIKVELNAGFGSGQGPRSIVGGVAFQNRTSSMLLERCGTDSSEEDLPIRTLHVDRKRYSGAGMGIPLSGKLLTSSALVGLFCAVGWAQAPGSEVPGGELNEWCPVMPEEKADPEITTTYLGKTVAFCCDMCWKKFRGNPERYLARLPQFSDVVGEESAPEASATEATDSEAKAGESGEAEDGEERIPFAGRLHPVMVHFPLAGVPVALLGFLLWVTTGREAFARADVPALLVATLGAGGAYLTGDIARESIRFSEKLEVIAGQHENFSTAILILLACLSVFRVWRWNRMTGRWRWVYGVGLAVGAAMLGVTGYLGGSLVFGPDHLAW